MASVWRLLTLGGAVAAFVLLSTQLATAAQCTSSG